MATFNSINNGIKHNVATSIALGNAAFNAETSSTNSLAVGNLALTACTTGSNNTAVGYNTLATTITDLRNTAVGSQALATLNGANDNTAIGQTALQHLTTGPQNTALGSNALKTDTTGTGNIAIGFGSMANYNDAGNNKGFNIAIGLNSIRDATGAVNGNIGIGLSALQNINGATNNVSIGTYQSTDQQITSGSSNVNVGYQSLNNIITGSNNIALGANAGNSYTTGSESNNICIGNTGSAASVSGEIQIGTNGTHMTAFMQGISGVTVTGASVLISTAGKMGTVVSSARYKNNIKDMSSSSSSIMKMRPVTFSYKSETTQQQHYGLIAEEVATIAPELVIYGQDGLPETVQYHQFTAMLLNELQKACKRIDNLEQTLAQRS